MTESFACKDTNSLDDLQSSARPRAVKVSGCTIVLALLLLTGLVPRTTSAQQPGQKVSMSLAVTNNRPVVSIVNNHTVPIEACFLTIKYPSGQRGGIGPIFYDTHAHRRDKPILPGQSQQFTLGPLQDQQTPAPTLQAVIFADGSTWGDPDRVQQILRARKILSDRLEKMMTLLQTLISQKASRDQALSAVQAEWDAWNKSKPGSLPITTPDDFYTIPSIDALEEDSRNTLVFYMVKSNIERSPISVREAADESKFLTMLNGVLARWDADLKAAKPPMPN